MANLQHNWEVVGSSDHQGGPKVWKCGSCKQTSIQKEKPPTDGCTGDPVARLRAEVEQEIKDHPKWCGPECQTFLPGAYREARIIRGVSFEKIHYDLCHIWR